MAGGMTQNSYDDLALVNMALTQLGSVAISSLDEESDLAAICARLYPLTRDAALSLHPYLCTLAERALAIDADAAPAGRFKTAFKLPSDLLAGPFNVLGDGAQVNDGEWLVMGDHLHANYKTVLITYRVRPAINTLPPYLVKQIVAETAAELAIPVTENSQRADVLAGKAEMLAAKVKPVNAQSRPMQSLFKNGDPISGTRY
jgi:hypothetical protein